MASAANERRRVDAEIGPSLHDRAEAIAERLDRWARAGGRALPDALLEKLERLIELSMRAAIFTFERKRASRSDGTVPAPPQTPEASSPTGPPSAATPAGQPSSSAPAGAAGAHAATDAGHPASAPPVRADARS